MLPIISLIFLMIVVFGITIFFLRKIFYGETEGALSRLDGVYQDLLNKQKELTEKIAQQEKDYEAKKEEANQVAKRMATQSLEELRKKEDEIIKKARGEADEIINKARESSAKNYREIEKQLSGKTIDFASDLLSKSLDVQMLIPLHQEIVTEFLGRSKNVDVSAVGSDLEQVIVKTPVKLTPEQLAQIKKLVTEKFKKEIKIEEVLDVKLIAGVSLEFGTLVIDGSLVNRIREASEQAKKELEKTT